MTMTSRRIRQNDAKRAGTGGNNGNEQNDDAEKTVSLLCIVEKTLSEYELLAKKQRPADAADVSADCQ